MDVDTKYTMDQLIDTLYNLHLQVLTKLLNGERLTTIQKELQNEFQETNYLRIAENGLLSFNKKGELIGAYPVSPEKTKYKVEIEDVGTGYSMCAIDALGIAYTFKKKTKIHSEDYKTGEIIKIEIDPSSNSEIEDKNLFVTYIKSSDDSCDPAVDQCPSLNFYTSLDNIDNPERYTIMNYKEALEHSIAVFGEMGIKQCIKGALEGSKNFSLSDILVNVFE